MRHTGTPVVFSPFAVVDAVIPESDLIPELFSPCLDFPVIIRLLRLAVAPRSGGGDHDEYVIRNFDIRDNGIKMICHLRQITGNLFRFYPVGDFGGHLPDQIGASQISFVKIFPAFFAVARLKCILRHKIGKTRLKTGRCPVAGAIAGTLDSAYCGIFPFQIGADIKKNFIADAGIAQAELSGIRHLRVGITPAVFA